MSKAITVFAKTSKEYHRLQAAANLITAETGKETNVNNILFDAGQNWTWTTISIESGLSTFPFMPALNPKQQERIVYGNLEEWTKTVKELISHFA